jgi:hypothetical protein
MRARRGIVGRYLNAADSVKIKVPVPFSSARPLFFRAFSSASRVISRVLQKFKLDLPIKALFDAPTVARMADVVRQNQAHRVDAAALEQMLRLVETMTDEDAQRQAGRISLVN